MESRRVFFVAHMAMERDTSMVVEMVPVKGGIGSIFHPPGSARTISGI